MIDSLVNFNDAIQKSNILKKIECPEAYGLMTFHRPSNVDRKETLMELLNTIEKMLQYSHYGASLTSKNQKNL